jgi:DNA-binding IclR family transcriptional regulator
LRFHFKAHTIQHVNARTSASERSQGQAGATRDGSVTGAQTLLRALDILECFTQDGTSLSLVEIGRRVQLTAPTTHRLVKALVSRGFLIGDASRHYTLGPAVMQLASVVMHRTENLAAVASPAIERLRDLIGETVSLHCLLGDDRICVAEYVSPERIRMESGIGGVYPLYAGAAGKAMLAWLPEVLDRVATRLEPHGPATITDPAELAKELARVRRRGYAQSEGEVVVGATSMAVPLFGSNGSVIGAINVAGPSTRWNRSKIARFRDDVVREADQLMRELASSGPPALA